MHEAVKNKTKLANYRYNVMPFGLKNTSIMYQRIMNNIFEEEIGEMLEVYMYYMILKSKEEQLHDIYVTNIFN